MLLRPFLNMSALFLTNMVSDSGANVGPCWNSQLLQRISTNIQESATNKINIITREREKEREKKKGEDNRPPTVRRQTCMGVVCCARNWRHCCTPTLACSQLYFLEWHRARSRHDSLAEWSKALASGASPQGRGLEPHSCHIVPQTRSLRRMYPKRKRSHNPKFLTTDQNPNPKV